MRNWQAALTHIFYGVIGAAILMLFTHLWVPSPQSIAVVDLTGVVNRYVATVAKKNLSKAQATRRIQLFATQLETTLKKLSQHYHVVIMPKQAVISGAPDLTKKIMEKFVMTNNARLNQDTPTMTASPLSDAK